VSRPTAHLEVLAPGVLTTVQDRGRTGVAHLGVPRAGALDAPAAELANRVVGNGADAALLEVTFGGLVLRAGAGRWVAVTGAPGPVTVAGAAVPHGEAVWLPAGGVLEVGHPVRGVRSYVAVAGGIDVPPVLGSRSTDTLAGVGPAPVAAGDRLPLGPAVAPPAHHDAPHPARPGPLRLLPGPRADWCAPDVLRALAAAPYVVQADSNRVGLRLQGRPLARVRDEELPSEGIVLGAVQVPPDGQPVVFLADHPPTGGYPVVAVVVAEDLWRCAQLRPGEEVRFTPASGTPGSPGRRGPAARAGATG
jgi:biotin-dependent carboxylase-like uncharacterized protein